MPSRYIREGINDSDRVNLLSDKAEIFYRRLLLVVDDYGRYDSHPALLRAHCYPKKLDLVSESDINKWLQECQNANLVLLYNVNNKSYLEVIDFKQRVRTTSKYPSPEDSEEVLTKAEIAAVCQTNDGHVDGENAAEKLSNDGTVRYSIFENDIRERYSSTSSGADGCPAPTNPPALKFFCKRRGKKTPCNLYGKNILLTADEHRQLISDLGEELALRAIDEYDTRYPNSPAIQKHTDHNLAIRDYLNRGFICKSFVAGKTQADGVTNVFCG